MKDYELIIDTINTAEKMLNDYDKIVQREIKIYSTIALEQVADYLFDVLKNADFPKINISACRSVGQRGDGIPFGEMHLCSNKSTYLVNGIYFNAQLYICSNNSTTRIYFNNEGYITQGENNQAPLLFLCAWWQKLKEQLEPQIDAAFEVRNEEIRRKVNEIKVRKHIVDNFTI